MKYETYGYLESSRDKKKFNFISDGPKGKIEMVVKFEEMEVPGIFNLSFGTKLPDGSINDLVRIGNGDTKKILAVLPHETGCTACW